MTYSSECWYVSAGLNGVTARAKRTFDKLLDNTKHREMRKNPTTGMSEFLFLRLSVPTYIVCVCSQVASPIAYAAPAVTKYAAPALGYAAFGSYGLEYVH